jgi:NADH dehydrogenase
MTTRTFTVFGGTGFLGRRIVRHLHQAGHAVRIASRHPERSRELFGAGAPRLHAVEANVHDDGSVAAAIADAYGVVNAVSLYVERGSETFHDLHVGCAGRVAEQAQEAGATRLLHVSGIGADAGSRSSYIRSRGEGEAMVRAAFPTAIVLRPAVMFGPGDSFVQVIADLLRRSPIYPLFGRGNTRLQPTFVEDVAEAAVRALARPEDGPVAYECAGPRVYRYEELLRTIAEAMGRRPLLVPLGFPAWHALAAVAELLPSPPITRNQVELMQIDNVASGLPGFAELGIAPRPLEEILPAILRGS